MTVVVVFFVFLNKKKQHFMTMLVTN